jgi:uncharacterized membrane protein YidH (DUF202 family)
LNIADTNIAQSQEGRNAMNPLKLLAMLLIVGGVIGLAYGGFSYTRQTHDVKVGPVELSVNDKRSVNIPLWASVAAVVVGAGLLATGGRKT